MTIENITENLVGQIDAINCLKKHNETIKELYREIDKNLELLDWTVPKCDDPQLQNDYRNLKDYVIRLRNILLEDEEDVDMVTLD